MSKIKPLTDENIFSFLNQETNNETIQDDPIEYSELFRPPDPAHSGHPFRFYPATHSEHSGHP